MFVLNADVNLKTNKVIKENKGMEELIKRISEKTGLPEDKAKGAV